MDKVLSAMPRIANPNVLVGFDTADDAGVYRLTPDLALVQTIDFFTPIVDDPFTFGAIAAANALSDIYAMGGTPLSSLSVVAFPANGDPEVLEAIMRGGLEKMREAGCVVLGGHSVADPEMKFGYAVTGTIHPDRIKANSGARGGDLLVFTKAIGTGVIGTALKQGIATPESVDAAIASMLTLNRAACEGMLQLRPAPDARMSAASGFWGMRGRWRWRAASRWKSKRHAFLYCPVRWTPFARAPCPAASRTIAEFVSCAVDGAGEYRPVASRSAL